MAFRIRMGIPEMRELWEKLQIGHRTVTNSKNNEQLYIKWGNALKKLSENPFYPSLHTHEIVELTRRYGLKVLQSYLENKKSGAMRMFWVYGPEKDEITIIGLEPHPEDKKKAYDRIKLSEL